MSMAMSPQLAPQTHMPSSFFRYEDEDNTAQKVPEGHRHLNHVEYSYGHNHDEDEDDDNSSLDRSSITLSMHSCADTILDSAPDLDLDESRDGDDEDEETTTIAAPHGYAPSSSSSPAPALPQEAAAIAHPFPQPLQQASPLLVHHQQQQQTAFEPPSSVTGTTDESNSYTTSTPPPAAASPPPTAAATTESGTDSTGVAGGTAVFAPHTPPGPYSHETRTRYARHYSTPTSPSASYGVLAHSIGGGGGSAGLAGSAVGGGAPGTGTTAGTGSGPGTASGGMYHHRPASQPAGIGHLSASWAGGGNAKNITSRTSDGGHGHSHNFNNTRTSDSGHGSAYHSDAMSGQGNLNDDIDIFRSGRHLPQMGTGNGSSTTFLGPEEGGGGGGGDAGPRREASSSVSVSGVSHHRHQLSSGGDRDTDTQKSTTIRSASLQAGAANATNYVSLSRKSTLKKTGFFKPSVVPSSITGKFTIDPNLHVSHALLKALETPSTLVTDLFPGAKPKVATKKERRMANLHLDVENGGIDVDIHLVPGLPPPPPPATVRSSASSAKAVKIARRTTIGAKPTSTPPAPAMPVFTPPSPPLHGEYAPRISSSLAPPGAGRFSFDRHNMSEESYVRSGLGSRPSARSRSIDIQPLGSGYQTQTQAQAQASASNASVPTSSGLTPAQKMAVAQAFGIGVNGNGNGNGTGSGSGIMTPTTTTASVGAPVPAKPPSGPMPTLIDLRLKEARGGKSRKDGGGKKGNPFGIVARIHAPNPRPPFHLFASVVDIIPYTPSPNPSTGIPPPLPAPAPTSTLSRTSTSTHKSKSKPKSTPRPPPPRPPRQPAPVPYSRSASRSPLTIHLPRTFRGPLAVHVGGGDIDAHVKLSRGLEGVAAVVMESAYSRGYFVGRMREDGDGKGAVRWEIGGDAAAAGVEHENEKEGNTEAEGEEERGSEDGERDGDEEEEEEEWYGDKVDVFVGNGKVFLQLTGEEDPFGKPGFWKKLTGRA